MTTPAIREIAAYAVFKDNQIRVDYSKQAMIYMEPKEVFKKAVVEDATIVPIRILIGETSLSAEDAVGFILEKLGR